MAVALDNRLFEVRVHRRLLRCQEARPQQHPFGAEGESRSQPAAIGDATGSQDWAWGHGCRLEDLVDKGLDSYSERVWLPMLRAERSV